MKMKPAEKQVKRMGRRTEGGHSGFRRDISECVNPEASVAALEVLSLPKGGTEKAACEASGLSLRAVCWLKSRNREWLAKERELQAIGLRDVSSDLIAAMKLKSMALLEDPDKLELLSMRDLSTSMVAAVAGADKLAASDGVVAPERSEGGFERVLALQRRIVEEGRSGGTQEERGD
jgi:hypothetical protein